MNKKLSTFLIIAFVGLFSLWFFWLINKISPGEKRKILIIDTEPNNQEINIPIDREIFIYFNYPVKISKKNIKTEPSFDFKIEVSSKDKKAKIKPLNFLEKNKAYKVIIDSKNIKNAPYEINFKTGETVESKLKQDIVLLLKMQNKIPVYSSIFDLTYLEEKEEFSVIVNIPDCKKAKTSVLNYLKNNDINPYEVKISWYSAVKTDLSCVGIK